MMVHVFELLIWPILIHEVSLTVEDQMNAQEENNGKVFNDKKICLQCEKRRIVVISNNNFYGEGKSKLQYNYSRHPKCFYQHPEAINAHNKGRHRSKSAKKGFYQQIFDWISSMISFIHIKKDEYQNCVNCQKISKIPRGTMRMGRTYLSSYIYERIFNVYRSCGQCPNPNLYKTYSALERKNVFFVNDDKRKQSNDTKEEICIECSKSKRKVSKRYDKHWNETNFKEYIITEIFQLPKWKENLLVCVDAAGYVKRIFTNKGYGEKRVELGGTIAKGDQVVRIEVRKEMMRSKNVTGKGTKLMEIEEEAKDKTGLKVDESGDLILHSKQLKIKEYREINTIKSKKIFELLTYSDHNRYSVLPFWVIFKLRCPLPWRESMKTLKKKVTEQKGSSESQKLNKLLRYSKNKQYTFLPVWIIFKLNCPRKRIVENKGSSAPCKIAQTQNKTSQTEGMLRKLLKHVANENYSFLPFWIIFKLNCPMKVIVENKGSSAPREIVQKQNKTGQPEGMLRNLLQHVVGENYSFWPFWIIFRLNCPSTLMKQRITKFKGSFNATRRDFVQSNINQPGDQVIQHLEYKKNNEHSYLSLSTMFKLTCPSTSWRNSLSGKPSTEIRGNADPGIAVQRQVKLSDLLKLSQRKDFCFLRFSTLFNLKCRSNVGRNVEKHTKASLMEEQEQSVQIDIPASVISLLPIDTGRHSLIPFGLLFRLSCRQNQLHRSGKERDLLKQKQSKPQFKKPFMPYMSGLHSTFWLPFSKCSAAESCMASLKCKLPGYEQKHVGKRKSFTRFATRSSNELFSFEPFLLIFSPKCSAPKTSGSSLTETEERVHNLPEELTTKLVDRNNSDVCFLITGIYLRLKCRAKYLTSTLDRKPEKHSPLSEEFSLKSSFVSESGILLSRKTETFVTEPSVASFPSNNPESTSMETKFVNFSMSPPGIQPEKETELQDSLHEEARVIPSSKVSLIVASATSESMGSITEEKSREDNVRFRGEKMVSGRLSGTKLASSEVTISARLKTDFLDNVPVALDAGTKTVGKSSIVYSEATSTKLDQGDSTSTAFDANDSVSISTMPVASLTVSATTVASSSSLPRSAEAATSKAIEIPSPEPETSQDYRLQFEATASRKQLELVALKTSNISLIAKSSNESTTERLTTVNSNTEDLPFTSFDTGGIQKLQTTKSIQDLDNITQTTNKSVPATSDSSLKPILPFNVKASLPSHSQPYTTGVVPELLKDGRDTETAVDVSAGADSKEFKVKEEAFVKHPSEPEVDEAVRDRSYSRKEDLKTGESIAVPADVVILLTLLALACYKALKASFGRTRAPKPSPEISKNPDSGIPPNPPDQDHLTKLEETPQSDEQPAAQTDNQNRKLELETLIAVADIFLKPDGKIGYEIRQSKAG